MIIQKLLPGVLKEILTHVPTVLFKVIDWNELVSEIPKISKRVLHKENYKELFDYQKNHLAPFKISLHAETLNHLSHSVNIESGNKLLYLYFAQLFCPKGLFLDLRSIHFHQDSGHFSWHPTGLWTQLSEPFRVGLLNVYEGFYLENEETYLKGLKQIGMLDDKWGTKDRDHLADLFKAHFGSALDLEMKFSLDHFQSSILKVSNFMLDKEVNISKDFLYLGIYLVTLYSHLELSRASHPVKAIYLEVRNHFHNS